MTCLHTNYRSMGGATMYSPLASYAVQELRAPIMEKTIEKHKQKHFFLPRTMPLNKAKQDFSLAVAAALSDDRSNTGETIAKRR